jgi:hypothetical protein
LISQKTKKEREKYQETRNREANLAEAREKDFFVDVFL